MSTSIISDQPKDLSWYPGYITVNILKESWNAPNQQYDPNCKKCLFLCCPISTLIDIIICPGTSIWCIWQNVNHKCTCCKKTQVEK
jgi:hypothetical protein